MSKTTFLPYRRAIQVVDIETVVCSGLLHNPMNHLVCNVSQQVNTTVEEQRNVKFVQITQNVCRQ